MNSELIPNEEVKKEVLQKLVDDYWNTKATVEVMKAAQQPEQAQQLDEEAQRIAQEIKRLNPDFNLEVSGKISKQFEEEAKYKNAAQYEKKDHNQFN